MTIDKDPEKEEKALDALIADVLWKELADSDLKDASDALTVDDLRALESMKPGLIERVRQLADAGSADAPIPLPAAPALPIDLATALHRGQEESELTEKARQEMERKRRDLDARAPPRPEEP